MNTRLRRHMGYGLLSIFIAYTLFLILFYHADIVSGRLVAHAHFYGSESHEQDTATKPHSQEQLVFLQQLSNIPTFGGLIIALFDFQRYDHILMLVSFRELSFPKACHPSLFLLRAPPFC